MGTYDQVTPFLRAWGRLVTFDKTTSIFELEGTEDARRERRPEYSLILFNKNEKVIWSAP